MQLAPCQTQQIPLELPPSELILINDTVAAISCVIELEDSKLTMRIVSLTIGAPGATEKGPEKRKIVL